MKPLPSPLADTPPSTILAQVKVRPIEPTERLLFDQLIVAEHYLHGADLVGEQLRYVAEYQGSWVALLAWNAAAFHLKDREAWIGWSPQQKERRLPLVVNNSRFLVRLPIPNLASRVMKLCMDRLSGDWHASYGHEVLVAESFVDSQLFRGTAYKASGWTLLGQTQGWRRAREDFYVAHERPKQLWVRELRPGARTMLRGRNLPAALHGWEQPQPPACTTSAEDLARMCRFFAEVPDWRTRHGDYTVATLVTITVCAMLCGSRRGQRDLAAFAANMTPAQWGALRLPRRGNPRRWRVPKETTFYRLLTQVDSLALERALLAWQDHVLGPRPPEDDQVSIDGKELLNSQGVQVVSAYTVQGGRWLGSEVVQTKSNEIPAAQALLRRLPVEGMLVTGDALHTQTETARIIVQERGADYLMNVKGNQKSLQKSVRQLQRSLPGAFSPSAPDGDRPGG